MIFRLQNLIKVTSVFSTVQHSQFFWVNECRRVSIFLVTANCSTLCQAQIVKVVETAEAPKCAAELFVKWGCTESDLRTIFFRMPSLRNADIRFLDSKLGVLKGLGLSGSDLVKMINCRPRLLGYKISRSFDERFEYLLTLFGSKEVLVRAIVRNPSLLTYDINGRVKPVVELYERMGVSREDLVTCLMNRPTIIPRTSFDYEKMEYIRKTGVPRDSRLYKYVVTIIGISRIETIHSKVVNFEKFGFSEDEILGLFGRSPLLMTFSMDKVQRHMTFILGKMKLPASTVLVHSHLLYVSLERTLKPRVALAEKIQEMGIDPQLRGLDLLKALRMTEKRFVKKFVMCHPEEIAKELYEYYKRAKGVRRLAEASKKSIHPGFPF